MTQKSILVDIDETIKDLMEQLNQDFISDIRNEISSSANKSNIDFMQQLDELRQKTASEFEAIKELSRKGSRDIEEAIDLILGIEDIIKSIDGLDKVASSISEFSSSIGLIKTHLTDTLKTQYDEIMNLSAYMNKSQSAITNSIENAHTETFQEFESLTECLNTVKEENIHFHGAIEKDLSKINSSIGETGVSLKSSLLDAKDTISSDIESITESLRTVKNENVHFHDALEKDLSMINSSIGETGMTLKSSLLDAKDMLSSNMESISESLRTVKEENILSHDALEKDLSKINSSIGETGVTLTSSLLDAKDTLSSIIKTKFTDISDRQSLQQKTLDEINPIISRSCNQIEHKLSFHHEQLHEELGEIHNRLNGINNSIDKLGKDIEHSTEYIKSEINSKFGELSSNMGKIISELSVINSEFVNHNKKTSNMLDRILYLTTPFWNRKKLSKNEN